MLQLLVPVAKGVGTREIPSSKRGGAGLLVPAHNLSIVALMIGTITMRPALTVVTIELIKVLRRIT